MEDNNILLMRVLKIHYKDRLQILDEALKVIKEYSHKPNSDQNEYDSTTLTLQSMLNDLPPDILKYFLTMVPLPKNTENLSKNKDDSLNIRPILLEYLKEESPPMAPVPKMEQKPGKTTPNVKDNEEKTAVLLKEETFKNTVNALKRPMGRMKKRGTNRGPVECKSLLDLCADYVVQNQSALTRDYQELNDSVWKLVKNDEYKGIALEKLYELIRDINKKLKWLRLLSADEITDEIIREEYGSSDVFFKEEHLEQALQEDPFVIKQELMEAVSNFCKM